MASHTSSYSLSQSNLSFFLLFLLTYFLILLFFFLFTVLIHISVCHTKLTFSDLHLPAGFYVSFPTSPLSLSYQPGGGRDCSPLNSGKPSFFVQQPKNEKKYLLNAKTEFIPSSKMKRPDPGWGESGKAILQVSVAVFRALSTYLSGKDGSAPRP